MNRRIFFAVSVVAILLVPVLAFAQAGNFDIRYDPMTVKTVSGSVVSTVSFNPGCPSSGPMGVIITSEGQNYTVFLGPECFITQMGLTFQCGDIITVTASQRCVGGKDYLVAARVINNNKTFDLRQSNGTPLWPTVTCPPPCPPACPPVGAGPCQTCPPVVQPCPQACPPPPCGPLTQPYDMCCPKSHPCDTCPHEGRCHSCAPVSAPPCQTCPPVGAGPCQTCPPATHPCETAPPPSCNPCQTAPPPSCNPCQTCPPVGAGPQTVVVPFNGCNVVNSHGLIAGTEIMQTNESASPYLVAVVKPAMGYGGGTTRVILGPLASVGMLSLCRGQAITYSGSDVDIQGESFVVATSIAQGTTFLNLRTLNGAPLFSNYGPSAGTLYLATDNNF